MSQQLRPDYPPDDASMTEWIVRLKGGDEDAARIVWDNFFQRVRQLAEKKLGDARRRHQDDEDVALSAIHALCDGAKKGRFRQLDCREDLWQLLAMITSRKVANVWRKQGRTKEVGESALHAGRNGPDAAQWHVLDHEPEAVFVDQLSLTCDDLIMMLEPKLQRVAILKLEGHKNSEIAEVCNRSVKSIERYLQLIRHHWSNR
jgi:DNA-directed RNA polymerase specialized sigma24 family protein